MLHFLQGCESSLHVSYPMPFLSLQQLCEVGKVEKLHLACGHLVSFLAECEICSSLQTISIHTLSSSSYL